MSNLKTVGVVIPHYKAPEALQIAMAHLQKQRGIQTEIFIRDNSEDNILFTKAVNEGLRKFAYNDAHDYVMVLNQDANLHEECLQQLVQTMDQNPQAGICAPIALSADKSVNWAGSAEAFPWGRHVGFNLTQLPKQPFETYWINGACMLLRTAMLREIGLLDENMKFICSDADISFTARSRGWKCLVVPSAFVEHELGGSASTIDTWLNKIKLEDQLYFARKWLTGDLYRGLSAEGTELTTDLVKKEFARTSSELNRASLIDKPVSNLLTAITTCKGRLHHLKQTLPLLQQQDGMDIIVVDYGCQDGTAEWVRLNYPKIRVVEYNHDNGFSPAKARNFGAGFAKTPWLLFVDADIKVHDSLMGWAKKNLDNKNNFYLSPNMNGDFCGTFFCARESFTKVGGYDECFRGWGGEDTDLYHRLTQSGMNQVRYNQKLFHVITHNDEERFRYTSHGQLENNRNNLNLLNLLYCTIKYDIGAILGRQTSVLERQTIRKLVIEGLDKHPDNDTFSFEIGERLDFVRLADKKFVRHIFYQIKPRN
jgi:GT2 family glycosyltransferase